MALEVNGARGEVALKIGDVDLVIAATMSGLAALSTRLECKSFDELWTKLSSVELATTIAAVELLVVRGDKEAAMKAMRLKHLRVCAEALSAAIAHQFQDDVGNDASAEQPPAG